jgi:hypothetical protein
MSHSDSIMRMRLDRRRRGVSTRSAPEIRVENRRIDAMNGDLARLYGYNARVCSTDLDVFRNGGSEVRSRSVAPLSESEYLGMLQCGHRSASEGIAA